MHPHGKEVKTVRVSNHAKRTSSKGSRYIACGTAIKDISKLDYVAFIWCICAKVQTNLVDIVNSICNLAHAGIPTFDSYLVLIHTLRLKK